MQEFLQARRLGIWGDSERLSCYAIGQIGDHASDGANQAFEAEGKEG